MNDTAPVRMGRKAVDLVGECVNDELDVLCRYSLNRLLNDVVAVLVLDAFQDVILKLLYQ